METIYVGMLELDYKLVSVGKTKEEAKQNLIKCFTDWIDRYPSEYGIKNIEDWVSNIAQTDFFDYDFDTWEFLEEFYGAYIQEVNNGYAVYGM